MKRAFALALASVAIAACGGAGAPAPPVQGVVIAPPEGVDAGAPAVVLAPLAPTRHPEADAKVPITEDDPTWGSPDALVTVVEFTDFQCAFCGRVTPTLVELRRLYGPEKLRIVVKHEPLPFHQNARGAAEAAETARALGGDGAFWSFHDAAFAHQDKLDAASFVAWARDAGVDPTAFTDALASHAGAEKVDRDHALAKRLGVNGTPAFFVNGAVVSGAQPLDKFRAVIDAEMARAEGLVAHGTPRDQVYVLATAENAKAWRATTVPPKSDEPPDTATHRVAIAGSPVRGSKDALVTIVEVGDFECPFTRRVEPTLEKIRQTYGDQVRVVWKNTPLAFHPRARPAAELALEARTQKGNDAFWAVHDALLASSSLEDADLEKIAKDAKLDVARAKSAIAKSAHERQIVEDETFGDDLKASGTPHFFVNGKRLVGAQPFEKFQALIDAALVDAKDRVAKGTKPDKVYDEIMKTAEGPTPLPTIALARVSTAPARGPANAPVVIQEIGDYQCPFTKRVEETVSALLKDYPGKIRIEWRNLPLPNHKSAPLAAEAAMEAYAQKGSVGFAKMHALLFANQETLTRADLDGFARQAGLDMTRFGAALDGHTHEAEVKADVDAVHALQVSGTPTFAINGYRVDGAQPLAKFHKVVDRALADARGGAKKP